MKTEDMRVNKRHIMMMPLIMHSIMIMIAITIMIAIIMIMIFTIMPTTLDTIKSTIMDIAKHIMITTHPPVMLAECPLTKVMAKLGNNMSKKSVSIDRVSDIKMINTKVISQEKGEHGCQVVDMHRNGYDERLQYIAGLFCNDDGLEATRHSVDGRLREIQISPIEGRFIYLLIKLAGIKSVVEVGSLAGYSTECIASALPDGGIVHSIEISAERYELARTNHKRLGLEHKINQLCGDARQMLTQLHGPFDAMFIDGDKGGYIEYLKWAELNIRNGGLIIADNTLLFDSVFLNTPPSGISKNSWARMKEFNLAISNRQKYESIILPMFDGIAVIRKLI